MANNCRHWKEGKCVAPGFDIGNKCNWDESDYTGCAVYKASSVRSSGGSMEDELRAIGTIGVGDQVERGPGGGLTITSQPSEAKKYSLFHCLCGQRVRAKADFAGKEAKCPACGTVITIPRPGEEAVDAISESQVRRIRDLLSQDAAGDMRGAKRLLVDFDEKIANVRDEDWGRSLLDWAATVGCHEGIAFLLRKGVNPKRPPGQETPLHIAAHFGRAQAAVLLVRAGASVATVDEYGRTPLFEAAYSGNLEVAAFLIAKGADANARDKEGDSALYYARGNERMTQLLVQHGAKEKS